MEANYKPIVLHNEPDETDLILAEIDEMIGTTQAHIERQRDYVRSVSFDSQRSMKAIANLEKMSSMLETLKSQRAQLVRREQENHWQAAAVKFGWD